MKTMLFTMFLKGWDITNQRIFQSKIIKNHACNPNMICDASNAPKYQKVIQNGLQRGTKNPSKSIKIQFGTFQDPCVCICDPLDWKIVPKCCPRTSKWIQNGHLGTLKGVKNQHNPILEYIVNRFVLFVSIH